MALVLAAASVTIMISATKRGDPSAAPAAVAPAVPKEVRIANQPKVPGKLQLHTRERREEPRGSGGFKVVERTLEWEVGETAIIVCDMWDDHHCKIAAQRVGVMVPRMNQVLSAARDRGVTIVFAPSETMNIYAGSPYRKRMEQAEQVKPPVPIEKRCLRNPASEPATLPVDTDLDCDDCELGPVVRRHTRQHPGLDIIGFDGISDSGEEIYNYCTQEGIKNIVLMGVHTNYCILNRPFGIRQMLKLGNNVVLARDLTDALYDPRQPPHVSHARGTEIVVEHIETYLCPSILSADLMRVVPGSDGPRPQK
jgi:nicotinamidase-related amidase